MEILPAWLIEEIKKLEELKREQERDSLRPRVHIDFPQELPNYKIDPPDLDEDRYKISIPIR